MTADLTSPNYWEASIIRSAGRLFMLAALADQPRHGYGIAQKITEFCGGCCNPSDAMIYPALRDLRETGLIVCEEDTSGPHKRNVCELTEKGREALRAGADAWARHLPALGRIVAAAQSDAALDDVSLDAECCPTCSPTVLTQEQIQLARS